MKRVIQFFVTLMIATAVAVAVQPAKSPKKPSSQKTSSKKKYVSSVKKPRNKVAQQPATDTPSPTDLCRGLRHGGAVGP